MKNSRVITLSRQELANVLNHHFLASGVVSPTEGFDKMQITIVGINIDAIRCELFKSEDLITAS